MSLVVVTRFKNESHIMYEFIHHYLQEGVDHFILIDDNSDDNYLQNNEWLRELIRTNVVEFKKSLTGQQTDADHHLKDIKQYTWVLSCDMDEFMFSVTPNTRLKDILNTTYRSVDYIQVHWKLFTHKHKLQPISVIEDNVYTHSSLIDELSPSKGIKCIAKTEHIDNIRPHSIFFTRNIQQITLDNCHNTIIQNNHYRTQSDEFLYGVKEQRGGGIKKHKYRKYTKHITGKYDKVCDLLQQKRQDLIQALHAKEQVRPKIHDKSSWHRIRNIHSHIECPDPERR